MLRLPPNSFRHTYQITVKKPLLEARTTRRFLTRSSSLEGENDPDEGSSQRAASLGDQSLTTQSNTTTESPSSKSTVSSSVINQKQEQQSEQPATQGKSQAEQDEELRQKLERMSGGGGEAGLELEDGKPVAMGRGTRSNMFRVI